MPSEKEIYDLVCKKRFDNLDDRTDEIIRLLRGRNGNPGILDDVRDLKRVCKALAGGLAFILMTLFVQVVAWARHKFFTGP